LDECAQRREIVFRGGPLQMMKVERTIVKIAVSTYQITPVLFILQDTSLIL
jgi:hypothetical protein